MVGGLRRGGGLDEIWKIGGGLEVRGRCGGEEEHIEC